MTSAPPLFATDRRFIAPEAYDAFVSVIARLEATLDEENAALGAQRHAGLAELTRQKRQGFLELDRILRSLDQTIPSQDIIARLADFRRKLAANETLLKRHLRAIQEVTDIIVKTMREHESDGTYSRSHAYGDWEAA